MPKVTFVNEHRTIEVPAGRRLSDAAREVGIRTCRESFAGTGIGDYTVWIDGPAGSVSPPGFLEKLLGGGRGKKRLANKVRVLGDVKVWTQPGIDDRLRSPRPIAPPPRPSEDPDAPRLGADASGSAAFPYGHPSAVGKGERPAVARNTGKGKKAGAKGAEAEADESDESESE